MARLRLRAGTYYYRAKLPADVRKRIRRSELNYSLRTSDIESAQALALELSANQLRLCRAIRQAGRMTSDEIDELIRRYMEERRALREEDQMFYGELSPEAAQERSAFLRAHLREAQDALARNRLEFVEHLARRIAVDLGVELSEADARRLCVRLLPMTVNDAREAVSRLPEVAPAVPLEVAPAPSPQLSELVTDYLAHRDASDPMRPNTRIEAVAALNTLVDLLGDPPLSSVRNRDAQDYGRKLAGLPKRWRQAYRGATASEVLAEIEGKEVPRIEPATFNKELGLVKAFWRWAVSREELSRNAMDAVKPADVGSTKDKRRPFTDAEIASLTPIITAQRQKRPARYWVTLLLAYTGARLEEIAQLRKRDVFKVGDVWCLRICAEAGSVKNLASERDVPIHSAVIAKGFLEFVDSREGERLFTSDDREVKAGQPISKWFGRELNRLKIADRSKKGLHSFRHSMRDKLRLAGVDPVTRREILGHAHGDVEDQVYGDPTSMTERWEALEKITLPLGG